MRVASAERKRVAGFTLVEMAIVLVIIGIILAGVMKGRDIVRGSQVKQFSQQFAQKWATIAQTYYDKTGQLLIDGSDNGGTTAISNGTMDAQLSLTIDDAQGVLEAVGITPCTLIKSKLTGPVDRLETVPSHCNDDVDLVETTVEGEYTGTVVVAVDLVTLELDLATQTYYRNVLLLYNVPCDVAQGLDTAIDGKADGASGSCIGIDGEYTSIDGAFTGTEYATNDNPTATAWGDAGGTTRYAQTVGIILDF